MNTLTVNLVVDTTGNIDQAASTAAWNKALSQRVADLETETSTIADAISAVFTKYQGQYVTMPILTNMALANMQAPLANYVILGERVRQYVRDNSQGDTSLFVITKGQGGGVAVRADRPAKPAKTAKA